MIVGYNHNVSHRGKTFHVQTEDSGPVRPQLVTLLYFGGTIISSKKEQHKGMLRSLTRGEFDQRIEEIGISLAPVLVKVEEAAEAAEKTIAEESTEVADTAKQPAIVVEPAIDKFKKSKPAESSLEELIYAYLTAGQR